MNIVRTLTEWRRYRTTRHERTACRPANWPISATIAPRSPPSPAPPRASDGHEIPAWSILLPDPVGIGNALHPPPGVAFRKRDTRCTSSRSGCFPFLKPRADAVSPVHDNTAPFTSSAAASPARKPPGRSPSRGVPVILHEMRGRARHGCAQDRWPGRTRLLQLLPLRRCRQPTPSACIHAEMRLAGSLIMRCADAHQVPAGGALAVDRDGFSDAVTAGDRSASADHRRARGSDRPAAGGLGPGDHRHRPADRAGAGRGDPRRDRRGRARLLRCHRADRPLRHHRHGHLLVSSRATTRSAPAAPARTTSTARWTRSSTTPSSMR